MSWGWMGAENRSLRWAAALVTTLAVGQDLAPPDTMQLRYNNVDRTAEISIDGEDYFVIASSGGGVGPWTEYTGGVVGLTDLANTVAIGDDVMVGDEALRVVGATRAEGYLDVLPGADGTSARPTAIFGSNDDNVWVRYSRTASGEPHVNLIVQPFTFFGVIDSVVQFGFNPGGGAREDTTKVGLWLQQEYAFKSGAVANILSEWFGQWTSANGATVIRPIGFTVDWTTNEANWGLNGHGNWLDSAGNQRAIFAEDGLITYLGSATGSLWLAGQDRPLLSASLNAGTAAEILRTTFAARSNTGVNGNILAVEGTGSGAFEFRNQCALTSWYPGNLLRGWVDSTAWTMRHQFRTGYWFDVTLTGNQNNWNPTNLNISMGMRVDGGGVDRTITGISSASSVGLSGVDARRITFKNVGTTNNLIFAHLDGNSLVQNQFRLIGGVAVTVPPNGSITFLYDEIFAKWTVESVYNV